MWRVAGMALLCGLVSFGASAHADEPPQLTPLVGKVLFAPQAVTGSDGKQHLVYELELGNAIPGKAMIEAVDVLDAATGAVIAKLDRTAVAGRLSIGGRRGQERADLDLGQFGVLFMHVEFDGGATVPKAITHRISARYVPRNVDLETTLAETEIVPRPPAVLGPPLAGSGYVAADGCCDTIRHVRALLALDGRFTLAQRFAVDWEQVGDDRRLVHGDLKNVWNYVIYNKDVLAVADGTVVSSRNDLDDQKPGALPDNLPLDEADGNYVVLDIGGGAYVLYAHMRKGTVNLVKGDRVERGQVIGKVGNTGNSQAPHLHLHVTDGPDPLTSNGIPYVFDRYRVTAFDHLGTADFDRAEATGSPLTLTPVNPPRAESNTLPLDLSVVDFGG